jgi:tubulin polyglutamylase TTLL1
MIDETFKIYLIEVNTNPCYEISSTLLARLIPNMIENAVRYFYINRIAIDPIFPPPDIGKWTGGKKEYIPENIFESNRFELIFDELSDGQSC